MNQFVFSGKLKTSLFAMMGVGLLSMVLCFFMEPGRYPDGVDAKYLHTEFWTNFLQNSYYFTGISFSALLFVVVHSLGYGGWHTAFKRVPEAVMMFMGFGVILLLIVWLGAVMGWHGIYLWAEPGITEHDELIAHKSPFINKTTYFIALMIIGLWAFFAWKMRGISKEEDTKGMGFNTQKMKVWAGVFLPIAAFSSAFVIWLIGMSIDIHWYSTMFAWYSTASFFVANICIMILLLLWLKQKGYFPNVTPNHFHDLGKFAFGISVFWTYLWFSQFMLIWYCNNGEETSYFKIRMEEFLPVFTANLILNFVLPFLILIRNTSKRILGTLGFGAMLVVFGHWIDFYQQIKPGVWHNMEHAYHENHKGHDQLGQAGGQHDGGHAVLTGHDQTGQGEANHAPEGHGAEPAHGGGHDAHAETGLKSFYMGIHFPGVYEIGTFIGFLGLFLFIVFHYLSKASLDPVNDIYYQESNHHEVI